MLRKADNLLGLLCALCLLATIGCSRTFWREQADRDSYDSITERMANPEWEVPRIDITPDSRSRFADPYDPDHAPLPPDDPAAHAYMQSVNGIKGYKSWHEFGTAPSIENPQWYTQLGLPHDFANAETYEVKPELNQITLGEAIELSYIHSRDYQFQLEQMYLASLDVTFRRFELGVRYLGTTNRPPSSDGTFVTVKDGQTSARLNNRIGVSQLLPAGGQWAVELANNTLWLFAGPNQTSSASALSYSLTQPLLFAAGRKVILNALTQAERTALYAVRDLARFRKELFVNTVVGSTGYLPLLQRRQLVENQRGNVQRLEEQVELLRTLNSQRKRIEEPIFGLPDEIETNGFPEILTGEITDTQGTLFFNRERMVLIWIGAMSPEQQTALESLVPNTKPSPFNPAVQRWLTEASPLDIGGFSARLGTLNQAMREAQPAYLRRAVNEIIQQLQTGTETLAVTQLETQLANARNNVRTGDRQYQDTLDQFKIQLGLPPDLKLTIDESLLKPFELIAPEVLVLEGEFKNFVDQWQNIDFTDPDPAELKKLIDKLIQLRKTIDTGAVKSIREDFEKVQQVVDSAQSGNSSQVAQSNNSFQRQLTADTAKEVAAELAQNRRSFASIQSLLNREFFYDFTSIEYRLESMGRRIVTPNLPKRERSQILAEIQELREQLLKIAQNLQVIQINLRVELIPLNPFNMPEAQTIGYAMNHRLDLMNQRALVMDTRRDVEVAANALESTLNLTAEGDVHLGGTENTFVGGPGITNNFRLGVRFDAPLDKVQQRNAYRSILIDYQRQRRSYMAFEDQVKFQVRTSWRQLDVLKKNFNTARQAIRSAARQYDQAVELAGAGGGGNNQNRGASDGLNLINALNAVLNAQNNLIQIWVNYESARLNLFRDMGIMSIDERGIWDDAFYQRIAFGSSKTKDANNPTLQQPQQVRKETGFPQKNLATSPGLEEYNQHLPELNSETNFNLTTPYFPNQKSPTSQVPRRFSTNIPLQKTPANTFPTINPELTTTPEPQLPLLLIPPAPAATNDFETVAPLMPPSRAPEQEPELVPIRATEKSVKNTTGSAQHVDRNFSIIIQPRTPLNAEEPVRERVSGRDRGESGTFNQRTFSEPETSPEINTEEFRLPIKVAP